METTARHTDALHDVRRDRDCAATVAILDCRIAKVAVLLTGCVRIVEKRSLRRKVAASSAP